jgi:hypothetical protein
MIQGHTFTVLTDPVALERIWGRWYELLHGLTAPMFLFGGGLAYGLATRHGNRARSPGARHVRRAFLLAAIGYGIQWPRAPIGEIATRPDLLAAASSVGPLQLVGVCLLLSEAIRMLAPTPGLRALASAAVCVGIIGCAPWVWQAEITSQTLVFGSWLDGLGGSQFPLFPWAAFFLLGVVGSVPAAMTFMPGEILASRRIRFGLYAIAIGTATAAFAYAMFVQGHVMRSVYGAYDLWHTGPLYVLFRAGTVVAWLGLLTLLEPLLHSLAARMPELSSILGALSRQSLVAYVVHLLLLYGTLFTPGLKRLGTLELGAAGAVFGGVLLVTTAAAVLWDRSLAPSANGAREARLHPNG